MPRRWLVAAGVLLLGAAVAAAAVVLPQRLTADTAEDYCSRLWDTFDRTSYWARELGSALEAVLAEPPVAATERLQAVREGLAGEARLLESLVVPAAVTPVQAHALATLDALQAAAEPVWEDAAPGDRPERGAALREHVLLARAEARAAIATLREADEECSSRHARGAWRLLGRSN